MPIENDIVWLPGSVDTDGSPLLQRVVAVAANANILRAMAAPGDVLGDAEVATETVSDALFARFYVADFDPVNPPGSIGTFDFGPTFGPMRAYVLKSFTFNVPIEGQNPFVGGGAIGNSTFTVLHAQFLLSCGSGDPATSLNLTMGGERITACVHSTGDQGGVTTSWTLEVKGAGITYPNLNT